MWVLIPGLGRSSGGGDGNPLQYSCLENPMDRGAWWAIQYMGLQNSRTRLSYWAHTHTTIYNECGHPLCQEFSSLSLHSSTLEGWLKYNPGPHRWKLWFKRSGVGLEKVHFWQVTRGGTYCCLWYHTLWELLSCFVLGLLLVGKTNSCFIIELRRC